MTPATAEQIIDALQMARGFIAAGRNNYLCTALAHAEEVQPRLHYAVLHLERYIRKNINGRPSLSSWFDEYVDARSPGADPYHRVQSLMRLAWADRMLLELATKGHLP